MSTWERYFRDVARGSSVERATFFSDAVFAIAMTLLIIEIHVPEVGDAELSEALVELLPEYLTFVLSFLVVGIVWIAHHRKFRLLSSHDQTLLRMNLLLLLLVATLPLPTAILGDYGNTKLAACIYAANIALIGFASAGTWAVAWHRGLTADTVTPDLFRFMLGQALIAPVVFAASIPLTLLTDAWVGELFWAVALPCYLVLGRFYGTRLSRR